MRMVLAMMGVTAACFTFLASPALATLTAPERGFISSNPAQTWEEGLICGNGLIGANALSRPLNETIIFTHKRLFMPEGVPTQPPLMAPHLSKVRKLIDEGKYDEATQLAFDVSGQESFMYPDRFIPAFDLNIEMRSQGAVKEYMRSVNFQTGEAVVQWADEQGTFERRMFVSRRDGLAVVLITGLGERKVNCRLALGPRKPSMALDPLTLSRSAQVFARNIINIETTAEPSALTFRNTFAQAYPGSIQAVEGVAGIFQKNGATTATDDSLLITEADQVMILVDIRLPLDAATSHIDDMKHSLLAQTMEYATLLQRHAEVHGELFNRMRLDIGGGADHKRTTEELLADSTNERLNRALIEKEFDAGRYNIISCTGELPPVLQGGWAGTYVPGWASDFTHNGNVPSAIACLLMGNLPELMLSYTAYIESIIPGMEANAERIFGARGIVLPSRTTTNGYNNALAPKFAGGFWVGGAAWAAHFFYDYYLYTGDRKFLAEHAVPFMEKTAIFFEDYLYEGPDGKYVFSPTQSPENTPKNSDSQGSFNATMDVAAAKELLWNLISASNELGINRNKIPQWQAMLDKMPEYMISEDGIIKEWLTPKLDNNDSHRHSSQLYPLYDGMPEEIADNPDLRAAFKKSIEYKLDKHWRNKPSGFMSFGLVQLGQAATSLGEGEMAYDCLMHLVNRFWLNNLASMHNHRSLFNMDISGGMPAVIIKMLVASDPGKIQILPALPDAWPTGTIEGVLCRGQIEINRLEWDAAHILLTMTSGRRQEITLTIPTDIKSISVKKGDGRIERTGQARSCQVILPKGEVTIEILK